MKELYRLRSNQTTIVTRLDDSNLQKIVWTRAMEEYSANSNWVSRFNPDNSILLTEEETKEVMEKIKNFRHRL
jgi:NTP pyrophosphatase (non-canonical NTP hydrolase)